MADNETLAVMKPQGSDKSADRKGTPLATVDSGPDLRNDMTPPARGLGAQNSSSGGPAKSRLKHAVFEPIALVLLSLATVGTAWCSYQAAVWGAVSQRTMNLSAAAGRRAAAAELKYQQMALLDVLLFTQYINARASSSNGIAGPGSGASALEKFYADRFRNEAKTAFNAWMATRPFENPNAPPHPFVTNLYQPRLLTEAGVAETESQRLWQQAGEAGRNGRGYVLITVLFTCALFCGGTASKFDSPWVRRAVLALGLTAFTFAAIRLLLLPMRL